MISADTVSRIRLYPSLLCDQDENYARRSRRGELTPRGVHTLNNDKTTLGIIVLLRELSDYPSRTCDIYTDPFLIKYYCT